MEFPSIPIRKTLAVDLRHELKKIFLKSYRNFPPQLEDDCEQLHTQREALQQGTQETLNYLVSINQLLLKTNLDDVKFIWYTSIGPSRTAIQGSGLWFEYANVLFNLGISYMNHAKNLSVNKDKSCCIEFNKASGVFLYLEQQVLPHLETTPPDLTIENLRILSKFCSACSLNHSAKSEMDYFHVWQCFAEVLSMPKLVDSFGADWKLGINHELKETEVKYLFLIIENKLNSRKSDDHLLIKSVLDKLLTLTDCAKTNEILNMPVTRRSKLKFRDLECHESFDPRVYFDSIGDLHGGWDWPCQHFHPPLMPTPRKLFRNMLPLSMAEGPITLKMNMFNYVYTKVIQPLMEMDKAVLKCMVDNGIPFGIEVAQMSTQVPESLLNLNALLSSVQFDKLLVDLSFNEHMKSQVLDVKNLVEILQNQNNLVAALGINPKRASKQRSKPSLLALCHDIIDQVHVNKEVRQQLCYNVWTWANEIDYEDVVLNSRITEVTGLIGVIHEFINASLHHGDHRDDDDDITLETCLKTHEKDLRNIKLMKQKLEHYKSQSVMIKTSNDKEKLNVVKSLFIAGNRVLEAQNAVQFYFKLTELQNEVTRFQEQSMEISTPTKIRPAKHEIKWVPGNRIAFSD